MRDATPTHLAARCHGRAALFMLVLLAANARAVGWGGTLGFGSDNIYHGLSLTADRPAWLADLHYGIGTGWLVGIGASAERPPGQSAAARITAYLDRRWQLDESWAAKVGAVHYDSPWNRYSDTLRYNELNAAIGFRGRVRVSFAVSPDYPGTYIGNRARSGVAAWTDLTFQQPLVGRLGLDVGFGYADLERTGWHNHRYGNAGLHYGVGDVYVYLARIWTDPIQEPYPASAQPHARWVTSLIWSFDAP